MNRSYENNKNQRKNRNYKKNQVNLNKQDKKVKRVKRIIKVNQINQVNQVNQVKNNHNENMSLLEKLVLDFPDKTWNYNELSQNPNISYNFVIKNKHINWNGYELLKNKSFTNEQLEEIKKMYPHLLFQSKSKYNTCHNYSNYIDYDEESDYENDYNYINNIISELMDNISQHIVINQENNLYKIYLEYPDICAKAVYKLYIRYGSELNDILLTRDNNNIDIIIYSFERYDYGISAIKFYRRLSKCRYITVSMLEKYNDKPWDYNKLSIHQSFHKYAIKTNNVIKYWNWNVISESFYITMDDVINNPGIKWNFNTLSQTYNKITILDILKSPQYNWNYVDCMMIRLTNLKYNFNINVLKNMIKIYKSFTSFDQLNFKRHNNYNPSYYNYLPFDKVNYGNLGNRNFDGLWFLNFTCILNSNSIDLESIQFILTNYRSYIKFSDIQISSDFASYEIFSKYNFNANLMSYSKGTYLPAFYSHKIKQIIKSSHFIIQELNNMILSYVL